MTPASPEAPTAPPVTPPSGAEGQGQTFSSLAEARNGRPKTLTGVTKKIRTGHGSMYVTMNDDEFGPRECFVILGKPGGTAAAFSDALGRMITMALTHGADPADVVHQLRGIQDGGQICADAIGHGIYSGIGGQMDFIRGAALPEGGKAILALPSTAKNGTLSRIVPTLKPGAGVVTTRGHVHYVATEHGIVDLHGKSLRQRAEALIGIAHPDFRAELTREVNALRHFDLGG